MVPAAVREAMACPHRERQVSMSMLLESKKSVEECRREMKDAFRSTQLYGRVWGRVGKCHFCITNRSHHGLLGTREPGRGLPVMVYCRGSIFPSGEGSAIRVRFVYGFLLIEVIIFALLTFLLFLYVINRDGAAVPLHVVILLSLGVTAFVYLLAAAVSAFSLLGEDDKRELVYFFTSNLEADF